MIALYVKTRREEYKLFDLDDFTLIGETIDPDVREAFERVANKQSTDNFLDVLRGAKDDYDEERVEALAAAATDAYVAAFKSCRGPEMRQLVSNALQYSRLANATPAMIRVTEKARSALQMIGAESPINALRVVKFGIRLTGTAKQ